MIAQSDAAGSLRQVKMRRNEGASACKSLHDQQMKQE
jgi:hypothetical protein